ncbi:MAG: FeoB-associated Cys-rich membrane protein [Clostridium sp.]|jgi:hypothetical protein
MSFTDIAILLVVALLFFVAARYVWKHKGSSCGGDCSACPYHQQCSKKQKK